MHWEKRDLSPQAFIPFNLVVDDQHDLDDLVEMASVTGEHGALQPAASRIRRALKGNPNAGL